VASWGVQKALRLELGCAAVHNCSCSVCACCIAEQTFSLLKCDDVWTRLAKVRESKQTAWEYDVGRFNLRKLRELEVRKQYQIEITNRFAALGNLSYGEELNRAWENVKENIKISAKRVWVCSNCSSMNRG